MISKKSLALINGTQSHIALLAVVNELEVDFNDLIVYSINKLESEMIQHLEYLGAQVLSSPVRLPLHTLDQLLVVPSQRISSPEFDWLGSLNYQKLFLVTDGPRNIGVFPDRTRGKPVVLVSFFNTDAHFCRMPAIPSDKRESPRMAVSRESYQRAIISADDFFNSEFKLPRKLKLNSKDLVVFHRAGWSDEFENVLHLLGAWIKKEKLVTRVVVRGPRNDQAPHSEQEVEMAEKISAIAGSSAKVITYSNLVGKIQSTAWSWGINPEVLIGSGRMGKPGFVFAFEGGIASLLNCDRSVEPVMPLSLHEIGFNSSNRLSIRNNNLIEQGEWMAFRSFAKNDSKPGPSRKSMIEETNKVELATHNFIQRRYGPLRGKPRAVARFLLRKMNDVIKSLG